MLLSYLEKLNWNRRNFQRLHPSTLQDSLQEVLRVTTAPLSSILTTSIEVNGLGGSRLLLLDYMRQADIPMSRYTG